MIWRWGIYRFDKWWLVIVNFRYQLLDLEEMEMWSEVSWKCNMCVEDSANWLSSERGTWLGKSLKVADPRPKLFQIPLLTLLVIYQNSLHLSDNLNYAIKRFRIYLLFWLLISTNTKVVIVHGCHLNTTVESICSFVTCLPVFHAHVLGKCVNMCFVLWL